MAFHTDVLTIPLSCDNAIMANLSQITNHIVSSDNEVVCPTGGEVAVGGATISIVP